MNKQILATQLRRALSAHARLIEEEKAAGRALMIKHGDGWAWVGDERQPVIVSSAVIRLYALGQVTADEPLPDTIYLKPFLLERVSVLDDETATYRRVTECNGESPKPRFCGLESLCRECGERLNTVTEHELKNFLLESTDSSGTLKSSTK